MDADNISFFSIVCDEIMTSIEENSNNITIKNFINALTITVMDNVPLLKVGCTPFQMLVEKENVRVSYPYAFREINTIKY